MKSIETKNNEKSEKTAWEDIKDLWYKVENNFTKNPLTDAHCKFIIVMLVFFTHLIINPLVRTVASLPTEMESLSLAEYLCGNDWSQLLKNMDYYGVGFYVFFFPLVKIIHDRFILHQVILAICCLLNCIPSLICYKLMHKDFGIKSKGFCVLAAVGLSFFDAAYTITAINELPIKLSWWLIIYLLGKCMNTTQNKKKALYSALISVLLIFTLTVHTRALINIVVVACVIFAMFIIYRDWVVNVPVLLGVLIPGYVIEQIVIKKVVRILWLTGQGNELRNSEGSLSKMFSMVGQLFKEDGIQGFFNTLSTQLIGANVYSLGIFFISVAVFIFVGVSVYRERKADKITLHVKKMFMGSFMCLLGTFATIFFFCLWTMQASRNAIAANEVIKSYIYLRYFYFFLTPMYVYSLVFLYHNYETIQSKINLIMAVYTVVVLYAFAYVVPAVTANPSAKMDSGYQLAGLCLRGYNEAMSTNQFVFVSLLPFGLYFVIRFFAKRKHLTVVVAVLIALFAYEYYYAAIVRNVNKANEHYEMVNGYLETIYKNDDYRYTIKKIQIGGGTYMAQVAQYEMPDIVVIREEEIVPEVPLLTTRMVSWEITQTYNYKYVCKLDKDEFLYSTEKYFDFMQPIENQNDYNAMRSYRE